MRAARAFVVTLVLVWGLAGVATTQPAPVDGRADLRGQYVRPVSSPGAAGPDLVDDVDIAVDGGPLSVDPDVVFARVQRMLGSNVTPPERIVVRNISAAGWVGHDGRTVVIHPAVGADRHTAEVILAHEFAHVVQQRRYRFRVQSGDESFAVGSVNEGAAVYVSQRYEERYLTREPVDCPQHWTGPPGQRYFDGLYVVGCSYVEDRIDSPREIPTLYENLPNTSEQVLHNLSRDVEPPKRLSTIVVDGGDGSAVRADAEEPDRWRASERERVGEITLRLTLGAALPERTAVAASSGWGNDRLVTFTTGEATAGGVDIDDEASTADAAGRTGFAWVIRWDDARNTSEFRHAFAEYVREYERGGAAAGPPADRVPDRQFAELVWRQQEVQFRLTRVGEETTVVFAGSSEFVRGANAFGSSSEVVVSVSPLGGSRWVDPCRKPSSFGRRAACGIGPSN